MPQCTHEGHKAGTAKFKTFKGKTEFVAVLSGWNPVYHRFEPCDAGLIPPRKPGRKKALRYADSEASQNR